MELYNSNCLDIMKDMSDESVDCIVTDCPYRVVSGGATGSTMGGMLNRDIKIVRQGKLFGENDIDFSEWLPHIYRVLKPNKHCYIMINPRNLKELQQKSEDVGFIFQQLLVWDKGNVISGRFYMNAYELILMLRKGRERYINNMGEKNILRVPNIIGNKLHPTEKPVDLMKILVENSTMEGEIVLDPFMGVGSTGVACKELGRDFIGIEIDATYFNIAKQRIETGIEKRDINDNQITLEDII